VIDYPLHQRSLNHVLRDKAARNGDRPYIFFEDRTYSYAEVDEVTNRIANALRAHGVEAGMHVAVVMENKPDELLIYFALGKIGAVSVPINTAAKGEILAYFLAQSDSQMVLVDAPLAARVEAVLDRAPRIDRVFILDESGGDEALQSWTSPVPVRDFRELLEGSSAAPEVGVRFVDRFVFLYTSGTTGQSKANISTHCHALTAGMALAKAYEYRPDDVLYVCLPIFHGNAFLCSCLPALMADAAIAIARRFSVSNFWKDVRRYGVTQFNSLGAMTNFLWSQPASADDADNPVRQCMVVPTPREFYHDFEKRFGLKFTSLYALTDVCIVTITRENDPPEKWGSAGRPCDGIQVRIIDDDDIEVPPGKAGEIVVRSDDPWVLAQGYYNMPEKTLAAWRNLWFHTGDSGYMDEDGYLYFVDRKKDAIRRRGENISSFEVEQIILKHSAVREVAAFPVASEHSEDEVMVSVVLREGRTLTPKDLVEFCQQNMSYFMVPRYVEFVDELPKTTTEKVEKYKLRESAEARQASLWDREAAGIKITR
jgi:crotonobetaine/carnitine-CoA ligase